jgi:hypothetical protein
MLPMSAVQFAMSAKMQYLNLVDEVRSIDSTGRAARIAANRILRVNEAVSLLKAHRPDDDRPLEGQLWWVNSFIGGELQFFYSRRPQNTVVVYYFGEVGSGSTSAYATFCHLVLSGEFNQVMSKFGISIPDLLGTPTRHRVQ